MLRIGTQNAYVGSNWPDSIRALADCGFDAVDFGFPGLPLGKIVKGEAPLASFWDKTDEELVAVFTPIREMGEKTGVEFYQAHAPFPIFVKDREDINDYMMMVLEKCCFSSQVLGVKNLVVHPVFRSTKEKEHDTNLSLYRKMIPMAKKYGVKICLENLWGYNKHVIEGPCATAKEACWYIDTLNEEAGEECFGFCLDIGHANLLGKNLRQYINALGKRLCALHIHDTDGKADLHVMPYTLVHESNGVHFYTDWEGMIEGLRDIHYDGSLSFETFREMEILPKELREDGLRMIAAIGRYWKGRIEAPVEG